MSNPVNKYLPTPEGIVKVAIRIAGGKAAVAILAKVSFSTVYRWVCADAVPVEYACLLASLSGNKPADLIGDTMRLHLKQIAEYK